MPDYETLLADAHNATMALDEAGDDRDTLDRAVTANIALVRFITANARELIGEWTGQD